METKPISAMALTAARKAVDSLPESEKPMYFGDGESEAIYCVYGLARQIVDDFYEDYPDTKPTMKILNDLAHQNVL